jgi:GAF domain-containing protein
VGNDSTISQLETRYETLIRVSHAFRVHRDPQQLFDALTEELHRVVPCNYIYVSLRDEKHHTFNERLINTKDRREVSVGEKFPTEVLGTEVNSDSRGKSSLPDLTLLARKI